MLHPLLLLIICIYVKFETSEAIECASPNEQRTRIFDSIQHYQGNKIPFDPMLLGWGGSNVEFNFSRITTLEKNIFVTYDSSHIVKMKLSGKQIMKINDGAFYLLDCLHELLLDHNNIRNLTRHMFEGLYNLQKLDLSYNQLINVPDLVFASLQRLKILHLGKNLINVVDILAFENLTSLENLNLQFNELETIDPEIFGSLRSLKILILSSNKLRDINPEKWKNLDHLEILDLADNSLNHFDPAYNFSFYHLKTLNLSSNFLTRLNVDAISRYLPSLHFIDINDNPWVCDELPIIVKELQVVKIIFPHKKNSASTVSGITCGGLEISSKTTTEENTTKKYESWVNRSYVEHVVEKKIEASSYKINESIRLLQNMIIICFVLIGLFITVEIFVRTNCYKVVFNKFRDGNEVYLDNSNVENFRLLGR